MENPSKEPTEQLPSNSPDFFIVGIGTSAGGLEAIEQFFSTMPENTGMAIVVIQHLSPSHKSYMVELLGRRTSLPVQIAEEEMRIVPDNVYLIPVNKNIKVKNGIFSLVTQDRTTSVPNYPIDIFFESLARYAGDRSIGIVLSGTGSDGSRGLRSIKEVGGLALVQDPVTAQFDGMPKNAINALPADQIIKPQLMPEVLINYVDNLDRIGATNKAAIKVLEEPYTSILREVQNAADIDFMLYKVPTIKRRIQHRMGLLQITDVKAYAALIQQSTKEVDALLQELLIGVTRFFRNPEAWNFIEANTVPYLFKSARKNPNQTIRCWVPACSTGEEAYTLALLLHEYQRDSLEAVDIKIFATDVDLRSLEKASKGIFHGSIAADISQARLHRYFIRQGEHYQISRELRQMIIFTPHNLTQDVPFSNMDLISCRNVLIYLKPHSQGRILSSFAHSLVSNGVMFLGKSEHITGYESYFEPLHGGFNIFRKQGQPKKLSSDSIFHNQMAKRTNDTSSSKFVAYTPASEPNDYLQEVLATYMPPSLVVNKHNNVLYLLGDTTPFISLTPGRPDLQIPRIIHEDLRILVGTALHRVFKELKSVLYENVSLSQNDKTLVFDLIAEPIKDGGEINKAVLFFKPKKEYRSEDITPQSYELDKIAKERIEDLERKIRHMEESLHAAIEELETSNEELQATNEELMASNEELQSTNEELQSTNEELSTVNTEVQIKVLELTELSRDMDNLLESTQICTLFLDSERCIRKFTRPALDFFSIQPTDLGRPIFHFTHRFLDVDFDVLSKHVLESQQPVEQTMEDHTGRFYLLQVAPYFTEKKEIMGVVITFVDTTEIENSKRIQELNESLVEEVEKRKESEQTLTNLIYLTSHELKAPIRAFRFLKEVIQENEQKGSLENNEQRFTEMDKRIDRLELVIDDLLHYSRLTRDSDITEPINLRELMDDVLNQVSPPSAFEIISNVDALTTIETNRDMLERVLINLVANAIEHHDKKEGTINIEAKTENGSTHFSVADDGPGMTVDHQKMVFDLFHPQRPRAEKGNVGMGLFMAKKSVEIRGGALRLKSSKKRGVTVEFDWPHELKPGSWHHEVSS